MKRKKFINAQEQGIGRPVWSQFAQQQQEAYDVSELLTYSIGLVADWVKKNDISKWMIPEVILTSKKAFYKIYDTADGFKVIDTRRALGGSATRTELKVTDNQVILGENSFETTIDDQEKRDNPNTFPQLEKIKIRNLTLKTLNNDWQQALAFVYSNVSVTGTYGVWSGASTIDPIAELDTIIQAQIDTGIPPNKLYLDLLSWIRLKNNKQVLGRIIYSGIPTEEVLLAAVRSMLLIPLDIKVGGGVKYEGATTNNVMVFCSEDDATEEDPSFAKTFTLNPNRFDNMWMYREDKIRSDVYALDWQQQRVLTGPALVTRIQTS
jgi:hypothetical protein